MSVWHLLFPSASASPSKIPYSISPIKPPGCSYLYSKQTVPVTSMSHSWARTLPAKMYPFSYCFPVLVLRSCLEGSTAFSNIISGMIISVQKSQCEVKMYKCKQCGGSSLLAPLTVWRAQALSTKLTLRSNIIRRAVAIWYHPPLDFLRKLRWRVSWEKRSSRFSCYSRVTQLADHYRGLKSPWNARIGMLRMSSARLPQILS